MEMSDSASNNRRLLLLMVILPWLIPLSASIQAAPPEPIQQIFVGEVSYNRYVQPRWEPITVGEVTIKIADVENEIVVSGRDKRGRPWNVYVKTAIGTGFSVAWKADLEGKGSADLIFVHQNTLNGRCVTQNTLTIILFDAEGRPSPWEVEGNFLQDYSWKTASGKGVLDIGDWNKNGRAELVQTACLGYEHQELSYTPYSLLAVYEAGDGFWRRLSSAERAPQEAIYRQIAGSGFRKLLPEQEGKKEKDMFVPDYSNDAAKGARGKIVAFVPTPEAKANCGVLRDFDELDGRLIEKTKEEKEKTREHCDEHLVLENGTVCFTSFRDSKPGIVLTQADSTEAVMDWESERAKSLLKEIIAEKLPVTLTGQLEERACSPTLIRANKP